MYEKIIVATDGSRHASEAVRHATGLAQVANSREIVILHVCPACTADLDPEAVNRKLADEIVGDAEKTVSAGGIDVRSVIEMDYPPEEVGEAIIDTIAKEEADLLVIGSRGLSEFKGILLGSISHRVLQKADCPVLVVRGEED